MNATTAHPNTDPTGIDYTARHALVPAGWPMEWGHIDDRCSEHDEIVQLRWFDGDCAARESVLSVYRNPHGGVELDVIEGPAPDGMTLTEAAHDIAKQCSHVAPRYWRAL